MQREIGAEDFGEPLAASARNFGSRVDPRVIGNSRRELGFKSTWF